jgi:hypothetical protein
MSDYYNHSGYPATKQSGASASARSEFSSIATAFTKLPALTGNALKWWRVNSVGTAVEAVSNATVLSSIGAAPATSGNGILKGNGSGGTAAATGADVVSLIGANAVTNATNAGNADTLDGNHASAFQAAATAINTSNIGSQSVYMATYAAEASGTAFYTTTAPSGSEAQLGLRMTGYNDVYMFNSGTQWGVFSPQGGMAFRYDRATATMTHYGDLTGNAATATVAGSCTGNAATATTASTANAVNTSNNYQMNSLGVGTGASGTAGEIRATNNVTWYYSSDKKFKENIRRIPDALDKACAIGGVLFDWTDEYIADHGGEDEYFVRKADIGVIAQQVLAAGLPELVRTRPDGSLAVDYQKGCALSFAAIAELKDEVTALKTQVQELKDAA